jgi:hypothetical protein
MSNVGYHDMERAAVMKVIWTTHYDTKFTYHFENFFHPYVGELLSRLNRYSVPKLLDPVWQQSLRKDFFNADYDPNPDPSVLVDASGSPKEIDTDEHGPYANYNWELFYHIPMMVGVHLSKTRRFAEARKWLEFVIRPGSTDMTVPAPKRFWNFIGFRNDLDPKQIDYLLALLSADPSTLSADDKKRQQDVLDGYNAMLDKPFMPHAIARTRHVAYQYYAVMKYLDNLIAWGDDLFQQYTIETLNEATQLYVSAANILGPRPEKVPALGAVGTKTFADLKNLKLDKMGNTFVDLEAAFPLNVATPAGVGGEAPGAGPLFGIGRTLYFCIPKNDKLLGYWDLVADRLFKIRHCMNIQGVVQPLALFDPPIDPGMLVAAAAAGIDIGSIVSGLNRPVGPLRSLPLIQKSLELAAEVKALGAALLAAIEKGDAEHLGLMRQGHEIRIQQMTQEVKFLQLKAAQEATTSLLTTRATILERLKYSKRLLGMAADPNVPETLPLKRPALTEENFDSVYQTLVAQYDKTLTIAGLPNLNIAGAASPSQQSGASGSGSLLLNSAEDSELNSHMPRARDTRLAASVADTAAPVIAMIPDFKINLHFWGLGGSSTVFGGTKLSYAAKMAAEILRIISAYESDQAGMSGKTGAHQRRADDWLLQHNLAAHEMMQNGRQILTSLIAEQIASHEYDVVKQQIANSQETDRFLHEKFTNEQLHLWMQGELSRLFYNYYRFAFDTARKAEQTMKRDLMRPELDSQTFVQFNYWDAGRKGLLAGEALQLDVKRMEMAYHDNNKRELEMVRHVSLRQLDPLQLLTLKSTGSCQVTIPEWLYDRDCPGHYMRRIKSVALSIPSVVGPYTNVNCTLTLVSSSVRTSPLLQDGEYLRQGANDSRFTDLAGAGQSITTSTGSNDSGMFETNLRDDRFLPYEGAGAISTWRLDLPAKFPTFDYSTISDVILHVRYTARLGVVASKVQQALDDLFAELSLKSGANLGLLFSLAHDFPSEWSTFVNDAGNLSVTVQRDYFPYFTQGLDLTLLDFHLYAEDVSKRRAFENPAARTTDLQNNGSFTLTASEDAVLARKAGADVFLIIRYAIG